MPCHGQREEAAGLAWYQLLAPAEGSPDPPIKTRQGALETFAKQMQIVKEACRERAQKPKLSS